MTTRSDTVRYNLEYYRKQAKALLKAAEAGNQDSHRRLASAPRRLSARDQTTPVLFALHDAQLVIAREQGFPSWPKFKLFIEQSAFDFRELCEVFVKEALRDVGRAEKILERHPQIAEAGLYPALVLGASTRVAEALSESPELATQRGGPMKWEPLQYLCFSRFGMNGSERADGLARTAGLLLCHGADVNSSYIDVNWPDSPLSFLYGAAGLNNNVELARILIDSGAVVDDHESLYHSTEHPDLLCMKLLLAHGATVSGSNALKHMLDREDPEGLTLLLVAGGDPNETNEQNETALHFAVWRRRSLECLTMLLDHGAHIDVRRSDGRTAYAMAYQSGQIKIAALLRERGADTKLSALDRIVGDFACAVDDAGLAQATQTLRDIKEITNLDIGKLLTELAQSRSTAAIQGLLLVGAPVDAVGCSGETALHWACWKGFDELAKLLLEHAASLEVKDTMFSATPPQWFLHGVSNNPDKDSDYPQVARLLLGAGVSFSELDVSTGNEAVDAVLREALI